MSLQFTKHYTKKKITKNSLTINSLIKNNVIRNSVTRNSVTKNNVIRNSVTINSVTRNSVTRNSLRKINSIIPLNIFQTWYTLNIPEKMKKNIDLLKKQNPEFKHYLYDDDMCRNFIKDHFDEDVLYTFDKLKPGAFKADLWRYCILYIHGGIYLDIKYHCVNDFRLLELTEKEYFVKDRIYCNEYGIYQALLCCLPKNKILYKFINLIVENVKHNKYENTELMCTGPHMCSRFFSLNDIDNMELSFSGDSINRNGKEILRYYSEYRAEQNQITKNRKLMKQSKYYKFMWFYLNIYNYPILISKQKKDLTNRIIKNINNEKMMFYTGNSSILKISEDEYLINQTWVNLTYHNDGFENKIPNKNLLFNTNFILNKNLEGKKNAININDILVEPNLFLENVKLTNINNEYYYIGSYNNKNNGVSYQISSKYNITLNNEKINSINSLANIRSNIIIPKDYDYNYSNISNNDWSIFPFNNKLHVIYNWYPLQIGDIDYQNKKMNSIKINYDIPEYFKDINGSTNGQQRDKEIWFILRKSQNHTLYKKNLYNYQHFFVVFDLKMNLIKYSELFKFGDHNVEVCNSFMIEHNNIILSYSLSNCNSFVSKYDINEIKNSVKWYYN